MGVYHGVKAIVVVSVIGVAAILGVVAEELQPSTSNSASAWENARVLLPEEVKSKGAGPGKSAVTLPPELDRFSAQLVTLENHPVFTSSTGAQASRVCRRSKMLEERAVDIQRAPLMEMVKSHFDLWRKTTLALSRDVRSLRESCQTNDDKVKEKFVEVKASFKKVLDSRD